MHDTTYDVAIIGGGAAGLSAAVTLARSLRSVTVIDAGEPRNAPAAGVHNLLGREGMPPGELLAAGRREAECYGAQLRRGAVATARRDGDTFVVNLADGDQMRARRVILATGLVDELPDIPGVPELWGRSVLHCPYCHGWEVRGQRIGVLATGPGSIHQTLLFQQLSDDVTLFLHTQPDPEQGVWDQLAALGVSVVDGTVDHLRTEEGALRAVVLADGHEVPVDALVVAPRSVPRGGLYEQLGGTLAEHPFGLVVPTDHAGQTDVPGVWAAGNVTNPTATVAASASAGQLTGAALNADLVAEDAAAAVRARAAVVAP